jgi:uncharacterized repeat protein (TIGR03803 family)
MKKLNLLAILLLVLANTLTAQFSKLLEYNIDNDLRSPNFAEPVYDGKSLYIAPWHGASIIGGGILRVNLDGTGYKKLVDFTGTNGSLCGGTLTLSNGVIYGMTTEGGTNNRGVVFRVDTTGSNFSKLLDFNGTNGSGPQGGLILSDSILYGMTYRGGAEDSGCIFKIRIDGTGYTRLYDFGGIADGSNPTGSLLLDNGVLYGMTSTGGSSNMGCIFAFNLTDSTYTKLHNFTGGLNDGRTPYGSLRMKDNILYGLTNYGGQLNQGFLFKINKDGSAFTKILGFSSTIHGKNPQGNVTIIGDKLYCMASGGGTTPYGTIIQIKTDGTGFAKMFDFDSTKNGRQPRGTMVLINANLYGVTLAGGSEDHGVIFKIDTAASNGSYHFTKLLDFVSYDKGGYPKGSLIMVDNELYGMTSGGGEYGSGTILKIHPDGSGYEKLLDFDDFVSGSTPCGTLTYFQGELYGMTSEGGINNNYTTLDHNKGCIFKIKTDGTGFTKLYNFTYLGGGTPKGSLLVIDTVFYGLTSAGGANGMGCIFKINPSGTGYTKLLDFNGAVNGSTPTGSLINMGTDLYGMTSVGGANNLGVIFKFNLDSNYYTKILDFDGATHGSTPYGSLIQADSILYGMTSLGGTNSIGCVFSIKADGSNFKLSSFSGATNGSTPKGSLIFVGSQLYGLTSLGGANANGCIFSINTDLTGLSRAYSFALSTSGAYPQQDLFYNKSLYGLTSDRGAIANSRGVVFKYALQPTQQAQNIFVSNQSNNETTIKWTKGNSEKYVVFVKELAGVITNPVNNTTYTASTDWNTKGSTLGTSCYYCVYNNTDSIVTLTNLKSNTVYALYVYAYNGNAGGEQYFTTTTAKTLFTTVPSAPVATNASNVDVTSFTANWNIVSGATSYCIDVATDIAFTDMVTSYNSENVGNVLTYNINSDINSGTTYYYRVRANSAAGSSASSNIISLKTPKYSPIITWANPANITYGTALSVVQLNATANVAGSFTYSAAIDSILNAGLAQNITAYFTPDDTVMYEANSKTDQINVTKAVITVTANDQTMTYGSAVPELTASYSGFVNGETSAVISGAPTITTTGSQTSNVDNYVINVSAGTLSATNYSFSYTSGTLTIEKASLTATANDKTKVYNTVNPVLDIAYSGFVNGDNVSDITAPSISTTAITSSPVGSYAISLTDGCATNYNITLVSGELTITKAPVVVTISNLSQNYTGSSRTVTVSTNPNSISYSLTYDGSTTAPINAGSYTVVATITDNNYDGSETETLTVNKVTLTVTADDKSMTYGSIVPTLTVSYSGFINSETTAVLSGSPELTTTASQTSNIGNYTINASAGTLSATNYSFSYVNGSVTIGKATLTATANDKTRAYNTNNPVLDITYSGFLNGDDVSDITEPSISTTAIITSPIGTYDITLSGGSASNYNITLVNGSLTITKPLATITISDTEYTYDGSAKSVTITTNPVGLAYEVTYNGSATAPTNAGSYNISVTINDVNYDGSQTGTLVINKVTLTVTAENKEKIYGEAVPTLTATYSGFVNSENATVISGNPTFVTTASRTTNVGTYSITVSLGTLSATNYSFSFVNGDITINKASATISLSNLSQVYDGTAKMATVTTNPEGLVYKVTYNGSETTPINKGLYNVVATIVDENYYDGSTNATFEIKEPDAIDPIIATTAKIYSNEKQIFVAVSNFKGSAKVMVYNILGSCVYQNNQVTEGINAIDRNYAAGTYVVKVILNNKIYTDKVSIR